MLYSGRKFFELRMVFRPTWKSAVTVNVQFLWVACCIANSHPCLIPQQVQQFLSMHMFFPQCFIFKLPESETTPTWCQRRGSRKFKISISFWVRYVFKYSYIYIYIVISSVRSLDFLGNEAAALRPTVDSLPAPAAHRTDESYRITECLSAKTHDMRCNDMTYECSRQFCHDLMPIAASQKDSVCFFVHVFFK